MAETFYSMTELVKLTDNLIAAMPTSYYNRIMAVRNGLSSLQAADVVPVRHGRWLSKEYMYGDPDVGVPDAWVERLAEQSDYYAYCSVCSEDAEYNAEGSLILSDYCPNCGANMKDGDRE